jgi:hypothetical protein
MSSVIASRLRLSATIFHYVGVIALVLVIYLVHRDVWHHGKRDEESLVKMHRMEMLWTAAAGFAVLIGMTLEVSADILDLEEANAAHVTRS